MRNSCRMVKTEPRDIIRVTVDVVSLLISCVKYLDLL